MGFIGGLTSVTVGCPVLRAGWGGAIPVGVVVVTTTVCAALGKDAGIVLVVDRGVLFTLGTAPGVCEAAVVVVVATTKLLPFRVLTSVAAAGGSDTTDTGATALLVGLGPAPSMMLVTPPGTPAVSNTNNNKVR